MENQDKDRQNKENRNNKEKSANKQKNTNKVSNGLSGKKTEKAQTRKNTRGKQQKPKKYINFLHLEELCRDNGYGASDTEIALCISTLGEKLGISITNAGVGKYRAKKIGVSSEKLQLYAAILGENINPYYLLEDGSDIKYLYKSTYDYYEDDQFIKSIETDSVDNLFELQKVITASAIEKYEPLRRIAEILGYSFENINGNLYLQIPESEKEKLCSNIPLYDQYLDQSNRIMLTATSFDYIMLQLQSAADLFKSVLNNYFISDLAQIVIIDNAHTKPKTDKNN